MTKRLEHGTRKTTCADAVRQSLSPESRQNLLLRGALLWTEFVRICGRIVTVREGVSIVSPGDAPPFLS